MLNLNNLPDIQFVETDPEKIIQEIITGYEEAYFQQTGKRKKLYPGDPIRIFLYSQALREVQLRQLIDFSAKQNLLKYAKGDYLLHYGASKSVEKLGAQRATVKVKFRLSTALTSVYTIPVGLRVGPGNDIHFETTAPIEIPAGLQEVITTVRCTVEGVIGNDFTPGQINIISDPRPYLISVENIETSKGGSDEEDDESYRERINLAPEGYSTAGPEGAYIYHLRSFSPLIGDVYPHSPSEGVVDIRILLKGGELPSQTFIDEALAYVSAKDKRPLTDKVQMGAPITNLYNIDFDYYISSSDAASVDFIQQKVQNAIDDYKLWQNSKIGRAIDPSELIARIRDAGGKRIKVRNPIYTELSKTQSAVTGTVQGIYGGLVDD